MTPRGVPKTAYEVRLDLLVLAERILTNQYMAQAADKVIPGQTPYMTKAPTSEQIIAEAKKLNVFVSKNDSAEQAS